MPGPALGQLRIGPHDPTGWSAIGYHGDGKIPNPWFGVFVLALVILATVMVLNFRRSRSGRLALAVRSNERATASAGVSVTRVKVLAFVTGSFFAGLGGVLYGYSAGSVSVTPFSAFAGLSLLVYAYLGGISSTGGALTTGVLATGGIGAVAMQKWLSLSQSDLLLLGAVGLVLTVVLSPEGIAGEMRRSGTRIKDRLQRRTGRMLPQPSRIPSQVGPVVVMASHSEVKEEVR